MQCSVIKERLVGSDLVLQCRQRLLCCCWCTLTHQTVKNRESRYWSPAAGQYSTGQSKAMQTKQSKTKTTVFSFLFVSHNGVATIQKNSTNDQIDFSLALEIQMKTQTFQLQSSSSVHSFLPCIWRTTWNECWSVCCLLRLPVVVELRWKVFDDHNKSNNSKLCIILIVIRYRADNNNGHRIPPKVLLSQTTEKTLVWQGGFSPLQNLCRRWFDYVDVVGSRRPSFDFFIIIIILFFRRFIFIRQSQWGKKKESALWWLWLEAHSSRS